MLIIPLNFLLILVSNKSHYYQSLFHPSDDRITY
jgi:hypothetical protein